jgi:hypothetical protein
MILFFKNGEAYSLFRGSSPFYFFNKIEFEDYGKKIYGINEHDFKFILNDTIDLKYQNFGLIGNFSDMTGRKITPSFKSSQNEGLKLKMPKHNLIEKLNKKELDDFLKDYKIKDQKKIEDFPYAMISSTTCAQANEGEDFYINTLFFMSGGYGILARSSIFAGRSIEDCCSPELYHNLYKIKLDENPVKKINQNEIFNDSGVAYHKLEIEPKIIPDLEIKDDDKNIIDSNIEEYFNKFKKIIFLEKIKE